MRRTTINIPHLPLRSSLLLLPLPLRPPFLRLFLSLPARVIPKPLSQQQKSERSFGVLRNKRRLEFAFPLLSLLCLFNLSLVFVFSLSVCFVFVFTIAFLSRFFAKCLIPLLLILLQLSSNTLLSSLVAPLS